MMPTGKRHMGAIAELSAGAHWSRDMPLFTKCKVDRARSSSRLALKRTMFVRD